MAFSSVIQFSECCSIKRLYYTFNSKPGTESQKDPQLTLICTTTDKEIDNSPHEKPVESDYDQVYWWQWSAAGSKNDNLWTVLETTVGNRKRCNYCPLKADRESAMVCKKCKNNVFHLCELPVTYWVYLWMVLIFLKGSGSKLKLNHTKT